MGTHDFGYTYRHLCSYCACSEFNTPSTTLQIVVWLDNVGIYRYVLRHFSLSYSVDLKGSINRWDLLIGQKRPLD